MARMQGNTQAPADTKAAQAPSNPNPVELDDDESDDEDDDDEESDESDATGEKPKRQRTPKHLLRATKLRTKAAQMGADFKILDKWIKRDVDGAVAKIKEMLTKVQSDLETAAALYEELPASVTKGRGGGGGGSSTSKLVQPGVIVRVKDKFRAAYAAIAGSEEALDHLEIVSRTMTHVVVKLPDGERFFVPAKELEPVNLPKSEEPPAADQPSA